MRFSGVKINKLLGMPDKIKSNQFYLIESGTVRNLYYATTEKELLLLNTDEEAIQDTIGNILVDGGTIDFLYDDELNTISAEVVDGSLTFNYLQDIATNKLLGRSNAGTGKIHTISVGSGLSMVGGTLASTITPYTDEQAQDAVGAMLFDTDTIAPQYNDFDNLLGFDVVDGSITFTKMQSIDAVSLLGNSNAGVDNITEIYIGTGLSLSGGVLSSTVIGYTNEQAQDAVGGILTDTSTIDFTYDDVSNTITASFIGDTEDVPEAGDNLYLNESNLTSVLIPMIEDTDTIDLELYLGLGYHLKADVIDDSITFAKIQNISTSRLLGRTAAGTGDTEQISIGAGLSLSGGTLSSSITQYTDEMAQDTIGAALTDSSTIDFTYSDLSNTITATVIQAALALAASQITSGTLGVARGGTGTGTAFTSGSVIFADGSGVYAQDNANLFWDDTNNRLGIKTATPGSPLDVVGQIRQGGVAGIPTGYLRTNSTGLASTTNLNPGVAVYGGGTGEAAYGMDLGYNSNTGRYRNRIFMYGTAADIAFSYTNGTPPTAQSEFGDLMVLRGDNGNLGIHTDSPSARVHAVATSGAQFRGDYDNNHWWSATTNGAGITTFTGNSGSEFQFNKKVTMLSDLLFQTNGRGPILTASNSSLWRLTVDDSGNLGTEAA